MRSLRSFLIGFIFAILLFDWMRMRSEKKDWGPLTMRAIAQAQKNKELASMCLAQLHEARTEILTQDGKQELSVMSQAQAQKVLDEAQSGNKQAREELQQVSNLISEHERE